jgi:hypothetical protein
MTNTYPLPPSSATNDAAACILVAIRVAKREFLFRSYSQSKTVVPVPGRS